MKNDLPQVATFVARTYADLEKKRITCGAEGVKEIIHKETKEIQKNREVIYNFPVLPTWYAKYEYVYIFSMNRKV